MKKTIEAIEYLARVKTQNLLAIPQFDCTTDEGREFLNLWVKHLNKEVVLLADLRARLQRKQRTMRLLWISTALAVLALPLIGAAAYLMGRVDEGNEWVSIDDTQFCEQLGADAPKVHFK